MKWIKPYTRLLESYEKPNLIKEYPVEDKEFPTHLKKFKEVLVDKFEDSVFGVLDGNDVKLQELVPIKNLDEKESNEKWIILHNIKENYVNSHIDFFLRVYVLEENKSEFENVLAFAQGYPTIQKWKFEYDKRDQYQYKQVEEGGGIFKKKKIQGKRDWNNPKKVLIYNFSNKFIRDDDKSLNNKYWSGYQGRRNEEPFPQSTTEVDFAEKFYIDNFIRSLKKNKKISEFIEDDGSVKPMPALFRKNFFLAGPTRFISLKEFLEKCPGAPDVQEFSKLGYIPLNEFLKEMIGILGYDTEDWELNISQRMWVEFIPGDSTEKMKYLYILSYPEDFKCTQKEICAFRKVTVGTKEKPKESLRYTIFDRLSKGIPQKKAEEIYKKYKDNPTAEVEPKVIFELPK